MKRWSHSWLPAGEKRKSRANFFSGEAEHSLQMKGKIKQKLSQSKKIKGKKDF